VRIKSFTEEPADVAAYGPVTDESGGRRFEIAVEEVKGDVVVAALRGVGDRTAAEALRGLRLYVARAALPETEEDEFYHSDLLGLRADYADGTAAGTVRAIIPVGATEVLEIDPGPGTETLLVPFTKAAVPEIDLAAGRIVVVPPEMVGDDRPEDDGTDEDETEEDTEDGTKAD
jgi:16S rRNA processing protein RimM